MFRHAAIWMDDLEARIFRVHPEETVEATAIGPLHRIRHKRSGTAGVPQERFFHDVGESLEAMDGVVLVGPRATKLAFLSYLERNGRPLKERVVSIDTPMHPTDGQLVAYACSLFRNRGTAGIKPRKGNTGPPTLGTRGK